MKVTGDKLRHKSIMYMITVGKVDAKASVIILPDADHVNTSICPGVSNITYLRLFLDFSKIEINCENLVANKFNDVTIAPFGPSPYRFITSLILIVSLISVTNISC